MAIETLEILWYVAMVIIGALLSIKQKKEIREEEDE